MNKFNDLVKIDHDFLTYISKHGDISISDLYKVLSFSDSTYVEYPYDETEHPDINEGYDEIYRWNDESPVRISGYGEEIDDKFNNLNVCDNYISDGRLMGLTVDFGCQLIQDPVKLFSAINSALKIFGADLNLITLSFCCLQRDFLSGKERNFVAPKLEIRLPHLEELVLNRIKIDEINFVAAPRLTSFLVIDSGIANYDLRKLFSLTEICVGDRRLSHIKLPDNNLIDKIFISKGVALSVREKRYTLDCDLIDLLSGVGFSLEQLSIIRCGISQIDLSMTSKLKHLNLTGNPIKNLNLDWVPLLEYINLEGTMFNDIELSKLPNLKHIYLDK